MLRPAAETARKEKRLLVKSLVAEGPAFDAAAGFALLRYFSIRPDVRAYHRIQELQPIPGYTEKPMGGFGSL